MARKRRTTGRVKDVDGTWFEVAEYRRTSHGFDVILGWPEGKKKGRAGGGRSQVILTAPVARYLKQFRMNPGQTVLPIGLSAVTKLRRRLGHHIRNDIRRWWEDRCVDLKRLSGTAFSRKHGKTPGGAHYTRRILFGKRHHPQNWWKAAEIQSILFSGRADTAIAIALDIAFNSVRRLRFQSRKADPTNIAGQVCRPDSWWKAPEVQALLFSGRPDSEIAEALKLRTSSIRGLRADSRKAGLVSDSDSLRRRQRDWWKAPRVQALLGSGKPFREIAAILVVNPYSVSVLRLRSSRASLLKLGQ